MKTHSQMKRCDDCGNRTSQPVVWFETAGFGIVVDEGETVCRECLEIRIKEQETINNDFAEAI